MRTRRAWELPVLGIAPWRRRSLGDMPVVEGNDRVYFEAVRWQDPKTLCFKLWGHGDYSPNGFEEFFLYHVGGKVTRGCDPSTAS